MGDLIVGLDIGTNNVRVVIGSVGNVHSLQIGRTESTETENPWRLYNLRTDPTELTDLAAKEPEKLKSMVAAYKAWADHIGVNTNLKFTVGKW